MSVIVNSIPTSIVDTQVFCPNDDHNVSYPQVTPETSEIAGQECINLHNDEKPSQEQIEHHVVSREYHDLNAKLFLDTISRRGRIVNFSDKLYIRYHDQNVFQEYTDVIPKEIASFVANAVIKSRNGYEKAPFNRNFRAELRSAIFDDGSIYITDCQQKSKWLCNEPASCKFEHLVFFKNCIYNHITGTVIQNDGNWFNTSVMDVEYHPEKRYETPLFNQLCWNAAGCDQESVDTLLEILGLAMMGDTSYQKMFVIKGNSGTGKGCLMRLMGAIMNDQYAGITKESFGETFGLSIFDEKKFVVFNDIQIDTKAGKSMVDVMKNIIGRDPVTFRQMYKSPTSKVLDANIALCCNTTPTFPDGSDAFIGRIIAIKSDGKNMRGTIGADNFEERLVAEKEGVVHKLLEALKRLRKRGYIVQPKKGQDVIDEMTAFGNPVASYIDEVFAIEGNHRRKYNDMYAHYVMWCKTSGIGQFARKKFVELLSNWAMKHPETRFDKNHSSISGLILKNEFSHEYYHAIQKRNIETCGNTRGNPEPE